MGYARSRNQKRLRPNYTRYTFNVTFQGKRIWKDVECRKSEIESLYVRWKDKTLCELSGRISGTIFDNLDRYLIDVKSGVVPRWYKQKESIINNIIKPYFKDIYLCDLTRPRVKRFRQDMVNRGLKESTVNNYLNALGSFCSWCMDQELDGKPLLEHNPVNKTRLRENNQRYVNLTPQQVVDLIIKSRKHGLETLTMLSIFTGMRRGEICSITWDQVRLDDRRIHLHANQTKSKRARSIPLPSILVEYLQHLQPKSGKVLTISISSIERYWRMLREDISLPTLRVHDMRHIYAQAARDAGIALADIASFLGHQETSTSESRYAQAGGYNGVEKIEQLGKILDFNKLRTG